MWAELDDETLKYLESIMENEEKMQEVIEMRNEALTGMSLDDARSELFYFLNDTEMTMESVAENFEESMKNAINRIIVNKRLSKGLEDWYTNFTKTMNNGTLTDIEKSQLQQENEDAYKKATSERYGL